LLKIKLTRSHGLKCHNAMYIVMPRIWVLCKNCGSNDTHAFFRAKSIGIGIQCPTCGLSYRQSHVIASTIGESSSEILGDFRTIDPKTPVEVIWLDT
jgi:ssDNA-binding Zn-finger/Zn-ribbon topoisomerase 1